MNNVMQCLDIYPIAPSNSGLANPSIRVKGANLAYQRLSTFGVVVSFTTGDCFGMRVRTVSIATRQPFRMHMCPAPC
jgi:hypothetical protein